MYLIFIIPLFLIILSSIPYIVDTFIVSLSSVGIGALSAYYLKDQALCLVQECCSSESYINKKPDFTDLSAKIFGQDIAVDIVKRIVSHHLGNPHPEKALVLSFHGYTGVGKNHLTRLLASAIYKIYNETGKSKFVHTYVATHLKLDKKYELVKEIQTHLDKCPRSIIIIDEIDKLPEKYLDILLPFMNHEKKYGPAIFIFLGNNGGKEINTMLYRLYEKGKSRSEVKYDDFEEIISSNALKNGVFYQSELIERGIIDFFVPFLPLEYEHVEKCVIEEVKKVFKCSDEQLKTPQYQELIKKAADGLQADVGPFYRFGCKRVSARVSFLKLT